MAIDPVRDAMFSTHFRQLFTLSQQEGLSAEIVGQIRALQERAYLYGIQVATELLQEDNEDSPKPRQRINNC